MEIKACGNNVTLDTCHTFSAVCPLIYRCRLGGKLKALPVCCGGVKEEQMEIRGEIKNGVCLQLDNVKGFKEGLLISPQRGGYVPTGKQKWKASWLSRNLHDWASFCLFSLNLQDRIGKAHWYEQVVTELSWI
jgi:hypothetical protein